MTYPFNDILDQARCELEAAGFDEAHSNVKTIRFKQRTTGQEIYIDRDGKPGKQKVSFVVYPRNLGAFEGLSGADKIEPKHSSNYNVFPKSLTRGGNMQHEGGRVVLSLAADYAAIINEIQRGAR